MDDQKYTKIEIEAGPSAIYINGIDVMPLYRRIDNFAASLPEGTVMVMFAALAHRIAEAAAMADRGMEVAGKVDGDTMLDAVFQMIQQSYDNLYQVIDDETAASTHASGLASGAKH